MPKGNPGIPKSPEHREKLRAVLVGARAASKTPEALAKMAASKRGTPGWNKGVVSATASRTSVHNWLRSTFPKTGVCEHCGADVGTASPTGTQFSFNRHPEPHTRDREDYEELCRPCHVTKDTALKRLAA